MNCSMTNCTDTVTHIGSKGYIYCAKHAVVRRPWEYTRKMRVWELRLIEAGQPLTSYTPGRKPKAVR